jgi:hypothetical protein
MNKTKTISLGIVAIIILISIGISTRTTKNIPLNPSLKSEALEVFGHYLTSAKAHDKEGLGQAAYKLSNTCLDDSQKDNCEALMDNAYFFGSDISTSTLTHEWQDEQQLILSSDFEVSTSTGTSTIAYIRNIVYFGLNKGTEPKIIYFSPADGAAFRIGTSTEEEVILKLKAKVKDTDEDGVPDVVETCQDSQLDETCQKTDPKKRDTDGDGWWDGTEKFLRP